VITKSRFCPWCGSTLDSGEIGGRERQLCSADDCDYVCWNNPTPVVAAIAERNERIVLVRSHGWPEHWFGLIAGFLEQGETPQEGVLREVVEEVGLEARIESFLSAYPFYQLTSCY